MDRSIYLCWYNTNGKQTLCFIGNDYELACEKIREEFNLNPADYERLLEDSWLERENDDFFIEEQFINAFWNGFDK